MEGAGVTNKALKDKKNSFTYKKGFYNIPYLANSPETMIESLKKLPFVVYQREFQLIKSNTPFLTAAIYYQKVEEGLWLLYATAEHKANIAYDLVYDNYIPNDYYTLSVNLTSSEVVIRKQVPLQKINLQKCTWTFFKPNQPIPGVHIKGSSSRYITFYFNQQWLNNNLLNNKEFKKGNLHKFIQSGDNVIIQPVLNTVFKHEFEDFEKIMTVNRDKEAIDLLQIKIIGFRLMSALFRMHAPVQFEKATQFPETQERIIMHKVEKLMTENLEGKFPTISKLATQFKISESKLKKDFKLTFGQSVYQYYQQKQMELAKELLVKNNYIIKEVAHKLGYENAGKFTAAFKKHQGVLPSHYIKGGE